MVSLVSSSVYASAYVTTYNMAAKHKKGETASSAVNVGNLDQQNTKITISEEGAVATTALTQSFYANAGTLSLDTTIFDQRFQLYNSEGTLIADNLGTTDQMTAYNDWKNGKLAITADTYTVIATPLVVADGAEPTTGSLTITPSETQGSTLSVDSRLTGSETAEYYSYHFTGNTMKLDFSTQNAGGNKARVVVYNNTGGIVADSEGTAWQRSQYAKLNSATGLAAGSGDYKVKITYAKTADTTKDIKYNLQLYAGSGYSVVYKNKVTAPDYDNTAKGSVTATKDAQLYKTNAFNKINAKPSDAINIGWLQQDKSMLDVYSKLTSADNAEFYLFTLQKGDNIKFGFNTSTTANTAGIRVQLLDSGGRRVIADSEGTPAQQKAYQEFTTTNGYATKPNTYMVKISYAKGATRKDHTYEFGIYSGTSYAAQYKTVASAQTYANALMNGQVGGTSAATAIASYLNALSQATDTSPMTSLSDALTAKF